MAKQLFANNATSMLSGILTQGGNVLVCSNGEGNRFPSPAADEYFLLTIYTKDAYANEQKVEVVKVTSRAGDTMMIERDVELLTGQSGGYAYNGNTEQVYLELRWTAGGAGNVLQASDNLASLASALDARTNLGLGNVNNTADLDKPISNATQAALNGKADTGHTHAGFVSSTDPRLSDTRPASDVSAWAKAATKPSYTKADVGLGSVDNTSDANKPVSSAQQSALDLKLNTSGGTITANSTDPALKITQTGAGNALVVEDVSGDTTPFVISTSGDVSVGGSITQAIGNSTITGGGLTVRSGGGVKGGQISLNNKANTNVAYNFDIDGSDHGRIFTTQNNTNLTIGQVAGTGGLVSIYTGGAERMRIDASGNVGIGSAPCAGQSFAVKNGITGATTSVATISEGQVSSDVTSQARYFQSFANTQATPFRCDHVIHYLAEQGTFGAGSTVTTQTGFYASSALTGATNNYGFYSVIPAGAGRWNFYAAGTAANYFAGNVGINTPPSTDAPLHMFSSAGGIKRVILHNNATTAGTVARYDLATGTPNAYSVLEQREDGAGNASLQLSTGVGVNQGIRLAPSVGNVTVVTAAGLGYGTGAGGTVTQATSKNTAVTLNKPTGQITMNNAALAAGAQVNFTLTNSLITVNDLILVNVRTPYAAAYSVRAGDIESGSCLISLINVSGSSLADAVVISFAIIKGATA